MYPETILPITAHIPHAGTGIPDAVRSQFIPSPEELWREIALVTDWYTAELFGLPGIATTQTPISRVVVDLERYSDDSLEEKSSLGQGVIYTHNTLGERIRRELSPEERRLLLDNYYRPWHLQLEMNQIVLLGCLIGHITPKSQPPCPGRQVGRAMPFLMLSLDYTPWGD